MSKYLKYWPALLIIAAFISGRFSAPDRSKEAEDLRKKERVMFQQQIIQKQVQIQGLIGAQRETERKRYSDSLQAANALQAEKRVSTHYRKLYEKINLSRASEPELDSLRSLLRANALHTNR